MTYLKSGFKTAINLAVIGTIFLSACNSETKTNTNAADTAAQDKTVTEVTKTTEAADSTKLSFDTKDIPVSTKEIGTFPYLKAPADYKFNDITKSDLKTVHFAVNGVLMPVEGKTYSTNIYKISESGTPFNMEVVQREYDKVIKDLGGVKVSSNLLAGQVEKVGQKLLEAEGDHAYTIIGVNEYTLGHVNTYIIKTAKAEVWVELSFYQNGGYIYILEKAV